MQEEKRGKSKFDANTSLDIFWLCDESLEKSDASGREEAGTSLHNVQNR
jgi:hypothetical protein